MYPSLLYSLTAATSSRLKDGDQNKTNVLSLKLCLSLNVNLSWKREERHITCRFRLTGSSQFSSLTSDTDGPFSDPPVGSSIAPQHAVPVDKVAAFAQKSALWPDFHAIRTFYLAVRKGTNNAGLTFFSYPASGQTLVWKAKFLWLWRVGHAFMHLWLMFGEGRLDWYR